MEVQYIEADLSKKSIDLVSHLSKAHLRIDNTISGFTLMLQWFKQQKAAVENTIVVMEHTGLYSIHFETFLRHCRITFVKVPALDIRRSLGITRGKSDKPDAVRIAAYGHPSSYDISSEFSTPYSDIIAKMQAYEYLRNYLNDKINSTLQEQTEINSGKLTNRRLTWTDSKAALIELAYALYFNGSACQLGKK